MERYQCPDNEFSTDLEEMQSVHTTRAAELLFYKEVEVDGKIHNVKIEKYIQSKSTNQQEKDNVQTGIQ